MIELVRQYTSHRASEHDVGADVISCRHSTAQRGPNSIALHLAERKDDAVGGMAKCQGTCVFVAIRSRLHPANPAKFHYYQIGERLGRAHLIAIAPVYLSPAILKDGTQLLLHLDEGFLGMRAVELKDDSQRCSGGTRCDGSTVSTTECETNDVCGNRAHAIQTVLTET